MVEGVPPKTRLAFQVGVIGHRDLGSEVEIDKLKSRIALVLDAISEIVKEIAANTKEVYRDETPILRIVSNLAEGAGRLVVQQALDKDYHLAAVLPFVRNEYMKTVSTAKSAEELAGLLQIAEQNQHLIELQGSPARPNQSYLACNKIIFNQSDMLIAIWDGEEAHSIAGTGHNLEEAKKYNLPIILIKARNPYPIEFLGKKIQHEEGHWQKVLRHRIHNLLIPPEQKPGGDTKRNNSGFGAVLHPVKWLKSAGKGPEELYTEYFREKLPDRMPLFALSYNFMLKGLKAQKPGQLIAGFLGKANEEWQARFAKLDRDFPDSVKRYIVNSFCDHYAWADKLAGYYANLYRSSFIYRFILGGFAVLFAALGYRGFKIFFVLQFLTILAILGLTKYANSHRWHERLIDYRHLAELLRQISFLSPLGGTLSVSFPPHAAETKASWISWHFRAIVREAGPVGVEINGRYLQEYKKLLQTELEGQINYHRKTAKEHEQLGQSLMNTSLVLFLVSLVTSFLRIVIDVLWFSPFAFKDIFTGAIAIICISLPAFAAAFAGIRTQGEFVRMSQRYSAMEKSLIEVQQQLNHMNSLWQVEPLAEEATRIMVNEVLDWRIVLKARPIPLPA